MAGKNISVIVKERPLIKRERDSRSTKQWRIEGNTIECTSVVINSRYTFDKIYDERSTNSELYENEARPIVEQVVKGYNGTIFAYGQTSSGKTFTMLGDKQNPGVIRLAARRIFNEISKAEEGRSYVISVRYLEIYNEKVYDLLNSRNELKIKELPNGDVNVGEGEKVRSEDHILQLVDGGNAFRKVAETNMNVQSSRSHAILQIEIQSVVSEDHPALVSVLNLVDLAGSERAEQTGATGERLKEAGNINKSLLTLSIVIGKLADEPDSHIGYRDSKLTRMLQNSLGGNSMTVMICAITPCALEETNNTLGFAMRAKKIENKPIVNEVVSDAVEVKRMRKKIVCLENELESHKKQIEHAEKVNKELLELKQFTIWATPAIQLPQAQRRKTWCGTQTASEIPKPSLLKTPTFTISNGDVRKPIETKLLSGRGCGSFEPIDDDFDEDDWGGVSRLSSIDENAESTPTLKNPSKNSARKSLLKTPKSLKRMLNQTKDETPTSSMVASPIALDKDKRIRALEDELEELRHFHQTETNVHVNKVETLQASFDEKLAELIKLNEQIDEARTAVTEMTTQLETARRELKEANSERSSAVKAKVLAEQQLTSIEYEYEQFKARASRREQELVEQLNNLGNDETVKMLKDKLHAMTEKVNSLETQIWNEEKKHKADLDAIRASVTAEEEKSLKLANQLIGLKSLQSEYDEVSSQLVDSIQENDDLKRKCETLNASVNDLNKKITDLEDKLANQMSLGVQSDDFQAKLQQQNQNQNHATELQKLKEVHNQQMDVLEKKYNDAMHDVYYLKSELETSVKETNDCISKYNDLYSDYDQLEHERIFHDNNIQQCRMTVDCITKELGILKSKLTEVQVSLSQQELDNWKLQKTICELNDTINASLINMNASTSVFNMTQQDTNNNPPIDESVIHSIATVEHDEWSIVITTGCQRITRSNTHCI